jgi:signal transduction histidine kinase
MSAAPTVKRAPTSDRLGAEPLEAMLAVSAAVAEADALENTLATIASTGARLVQAKAAAIILRETESANGLTVAASHGLSPQYAGYLNETRPLEVGKGPSGLAAAQGQPVWVEDALEDPVFAPWRDLAIREHYRSMVSVPLRLHEDLVIGVLNAYRDQAGPWTARDVNLLSLLADHAAIAIRTARLLDSTRRQVDGLSLMVRSLRAQAHEHSNRLHAIYGLLALGEVAQARRMIASVEGGYHSIYGRVTARIDNPTIAGFLVAESAIARESGIEVTVDGRSRLVELPPSLDDLDAVTVLGNLLHNAVETVSGLPRARRRVAVRIRQTPAEIVFRVRDWGPGISDENLEKIFDGDFTTKPGHAGIGLALVRSIVHRARGRIDVERPSGGGLAMSAVFPA